MTQVQRENYMVTGIGKKFNIVRVHAAAIAALPDPSEEWSFCDDRIDIDKQTRRRLKHRNVIVKQNQPNASVDEAAVWRVADKCYEQAQRIMDKPGRLSCCGASGITNDGGTIRCQRCGDAVPDSEIDRVFGGA